MTQIFFATEDTETTEVNRVQDIPVVSRYQVTDKLRFNTVFLT